MMFIWLTRITEVILRIWHNNYTIKIHVGSYLSVRRFDKNFLWILEIKIHKQVQLFKDVNFQASYQTIGTAMSG